MRILNMYEAFLALLMSFSAFLTSHIFPASSPSTRKQPFLSLDMLASRVCVLKTAAESKGQHMAVTSSLQTPSLLQTSRFRGASCIGSKHFDRWNAASLLGHHHRRVAERFKRVWTLVRRTRVHHGRFSAPPLRAGTPPRTRCLPRVARLPRARRRVHAFEAARATTHAHEIHRAGRPSLDVYPLFLSRIYNATFHDMYTNEGHRVTRIKTIMYYIRMPS